MQCTCLVTHSLTNAARGIVVVVKLPKQLLLLLSSSSSSSSSLVVSDVVCCFQWKFDGVGCRSRFVVRVVVVTVCCCRDGHRRRLPGGCYWLTAIRCCRRSVAVFRSADESVDENETIHE